MAHRVQPAFELEGVGILRDGHWIVRDATWRGETGSLMALVGPNGSGKSTLARVIAAHLFPTAGRCRVLGGEFGSTDLAALRRDIRLLQPAGPFDVPGSLTAREAVLTGCFGSLDLYETPTAEMERHADELLALVGLRAVARHPCWSLSGGERVRTLLARALIQRPRLLLLDEPTSGLDLAARERLLATLSRLAGGPTCVVLITHHIEEIPPHTAGVALMSGGRVLASGPPEAVLSDGPLSEAYGCGVSVRREGGRHYAVVHPDGWEALLRD